MDSSRIWICESLINITNECFRKKNAFNSLCGLSIKCLISSKINLRTIEYSRKKPKGRYFCGRVHLKIIVKIIYLNFRLPYTYCTHN